MRPVSWVPGVEEHWPIGRVKSQYLALPFRRPRYSRTLLGVCCLMHRKLLTLTRTFCVVAVTAFILASISGSVDWLLLSMVYWYPWGTSPTAAAISPMRCGSAQDKIWYKSTQGAQGVLAGWWYDWYWSLVDIVGAIFGSHMVDMPRSMCRGQRAMVDMP